MVHPHKLIPEWERQDAIIVVWPHLHSDWASIINKIEATYLDLCKYICKRQLVIIVAYDDAHKSHIEKRLSYVSACADNITFVAIPTNDTWVRDYGPFCISDGNRQCLLDFEFNGWGHRQLNCSLDNSFNAQLIKNLNFKAAYTPVSQILEAGNIEINSHGELLCSKNCFIQNSCTPRTEIHKLEEQLEYWLGCSKIYWLENVQLAGDDTFGHVDTLARFCSDDIIVHAISGNCDDPNLDATNQLAVQLQAIKRQSHNRFELIPLPLPEPLYFSGQQLPATYTNFLITNSSVLVPVFNDKQDCQILKLFDELFPDREIFDIECCTLIRQYGGLHCATMQIPEGFMT